MHIIGILLICIGLYGLLTNRHIIKMIIALNVLEIGLNIFIISVGYVTEGKAPIIGGFVKSGDSLVDPLPQALVLTAIVIGLGTTGLLLAVAKKIHEQYGTYQINEIINYINHKEELMTVEEEVQK